MWLQTTNRRRCDCTLFETQVSIGCYPNTNEQTEGAWKVKLNVKARSKGDLDAAVSKLQQQIPHLQAQEPAQPKS